MTDRNHNTTWRWLPLLLALGILLSACSSPPELLWPDAPGWSRAVLLGPTRPGDPVQPGLDGAGTPYYLLAPQTEAGTSLRLVSLGSDGEIALDRFYDVRLVQPDQPRAIWDGEVLQLLWISDHSLYVMPVEAGTGKPLAEPQELSEEVRVGSYDAAASGSGSLHVWFSGTSRLPGLYSMRLPDGERRLVDAEGVRPRLAWQPEVDVLHAIWARLPAGFDAKSFYYGRYQQGRFAPNQSVRVAEFTVNTSTLILGPTLAVNDDGVHLFWSEVIRTGMQAGSAEARHLSFADAEGAVERTSAQLFAPRDYNLSYAAPASANFRSGPRVALDWQAMTRTGFITDLAPVPYASTSEVAVATTSRVDYLRRKTARQIGVMYLGQQEPGSFQLLSFTPGDSETPALAADASGNLYATWLERSDLPGFTVYAATTRPDIVAALENYTRQDYGRMAGEAVFGLLSGVLLAPFAAVLWALIPMAVLFLLAPLRKEGQPLFHWPTLLSLTLAIAVYWVVKQATLAGVGSYVPFSAWIPRISESAASVLQIGVPPLIGLLAVLAAWAYTYRREKNSVLHFLLAYAVVDGGLTAAIYGVLIYEAV